jgi:hypothetical protein
MRQEQRLSRYPGIRSFEASERNLFFGRSQETKELYNLLKVERFGSLYAAAQQSCPYYEQMQQASREAAKGNYKMALSSYDAAAIAAKDCKLNKDTEINAAIEQLFKDIAEARDIAIQAKKEALRQKAEAEKAKKEADDAKAAAESQAKKAETLVQRLGGETSHSYFLNEAVGILKDELQQKIPDLSLVGQYLGIAAFAKETKEVKNLLYAYDQLIAADAAIGRGKTIQAIAIYEKIQQNTDIPSYIALYAQKQLSELNNLSKGLANWQKLLQGYHKDSTFALIQVNWAGLHDGQNIRFLSYIPDDAFLDFPNLEVLKLYLNQLSFLPESIGRLDRLDTLVVSSNRLRGLPNSISKLGKLRQLKAGNNRIQDLPTDFGKLQKLKHVELSDNSFREFPKVLSLIPLEQLQMAHNRITTMPSIKGLLAQSLQYLDLSHNRISQLSEDFGQLTALRFLDLSDNNLRSLPSTMMALKQLEVLDLSNNPDLNIDLTLMGQFPALKELYIYGCKKVDETLLQSFRSKYPQIKVVYK